jgi:PKD repeat protein
VFINVTTTGQTPVSNFSANRTTISAGEYIQFTDLSTNSPTSWSWEYAPGGGPGGIQFSTAQNPQYAFSNNDYGNTWIITLWATNANGTAGSSKTITVLDTTPPGNVVKLMMTNHTKSSIAWGWSPPFFIHYNDIALYMTYKDGVWFQNVTTNTVNWTGLTANTSYVIGVRPVDISGNANPDIVNATGSTIAIQPVADFTASNVTPISGQNVVFTDTSTNLPTSWQWHFTSATGWSYNPTTQNVTTSFLGILSPITVSLTATNAGGTDTITRVNYINLLGLPVTPVANFTLTPSSPLIGQTVVLTDTSTNAPTTWHWYLCSSRPGMCFDYYTQNLTISFGTADSYSIALTAANTAGSNTMTKYIVILPPVPTTVPTPGPVTTATTAPYSTSEGYSPHMRDMAVTPLATVPIERLNNITEALFGGWNETNQTPQWEPIITNSVAVYTDFLGPVAFLLIFLIPFGMMWLAHGNMKLLSILGIIVGLFVNAYLPANYAAAAVICIVVAAATLVWSLFKQ